MLMETGLFEEVDPYYVFEAQYLPNDPHAADTLGAINTPPYVLMGHDFFSAWDIQQGDTSVVIGVVDTGFLPNHQDLTNQYKLNWHDPIDGLNNDGDVYYDLASGSTIDLIDNFVGYDLGGATFSPFDWDNSPWHAFTGGGSGHGTTVAGVCCAQMDNNVGIAGTCPGCLLMPIKASPDGISGIVHGYDGLIYGAEHGCSVINLSWGSPNSYSAVFQDVVNYVVEYWDVAVVAAAGNKISGDPPGVPAHKDFYPASYENVLSVAGADESGSAIYVAFIVSYFADLMTVGAQVFTTGSNNNSDYYRVWGSSASSPATAGALGLLRSERPDLTAIQAMEQLRITGDRVDTLSSIPFNTPHIEKMGRKLNPTRALTDFTLPSVRITDYSFDLLGDDSISFTAGDTIGLIVQFTNYLAPVSGLEVELDSADMSYFGPGISNGLWALDSTSTIGSIGTLMSADNGTQMFRIGLSPGTVPGEAFIIRIGLSGNGGLYDDYQYYFIEMDATNLRTTLVTGVEPQAPLVERVYPNPFQDRVTIELENASEAPVEVILTNLSGIRLYDQTYPTGTDRIDLDPSGLYLTSGLYILEVRSGGQAITRKLLKY